MRALKQICFRAFFILYEKAVSSILRISFLDILDKDNREHLCEKYDHIDDFDSFITHRNRRSDMEILTLKEKSAFVAGLLQDAAAKNIDLKLRKKKG